MHKEAYYDWHTWRPPATESATGLVWRITETASDSGCCLCQRGNQKLKGCLKRYTNHTDTALKCSFFLRVCVSVSLCLVSLCLCLSVCLALSFSDHLWAKILIMTIHTAYGHSLRRWRYVCQSDKLHARETQNRHRDTKQPQRRPRCTPHGYLIADARKLNAHHFYTTRLGTTSQS